MHRSRCTKRLAAGFSAAALLVSGMAAMTTVPAHGAVLTENQGDVGVYTDGASDPLAIGEPTYANEEVVAESLKPGVDYAAGSMHQSIFEKDLAAGGSDFYLDRILGVSGTLGSPILMTRGRSLYMRGIDDRSFTRMGFAGSAFAGGPVSLGDFYTIDIDGQTVNEQSAERFNAPSHASTRYSIGSTGVVADMTKLITFDNVALTATTFDNPGSSPVVLRVRAASSHATKPGQDADELVGTRVLTSGANNGLVDSPWDTVDIKLQATGFVRDGSELVREVTVPAGGSTSISVVGVLGSDTLPDSETSYREYADLAPAVAVKQGITAFNRRYADEVPYINVPDPGVEKAIVYRWWGERYNSIDANAPGYVYQYPTTVEGSHLYQNAVALTQPMHLQDTKWLRTPYLPYGQILNIGELSGASAFLDSPGHVSWNNHYSQYIGTAGLEAYNVHGGGAAIAERFARYFEGDAVGQLEHYDGDGDNLIAYDSNNMPGNDADAISFGYPRDNTSQAGSATIERPESAYVWGAFDAARQLYGMAGEQSTKVSEMATKANAVRDAILEDLWSPSMKMFLSETSYGATASRASNGSANPLPTSENKLIPAKESNMYDVYAENLIPAADASTYVDGFRFMTYGDNFPIFPFYTANQYDRTKFGIGGSNNFSNINFTVQYRALRSALRRYDTTQKYVNPEYARKLLDWVSWSIYPDGDMRVANQAEYYSGWNPTTKTYQRNNPYHVMLGNMNFAYIEDMGGIQPRSDEKIELSPIDLGYDHFMVNNLRYHDHDVTIVWDEDGSAYDLGAGYSLFVDGTKVVTTDKLGGFTYDPVNNEVVPAAGVTVTFQAAAGRAFPTAVQTGIEDERVVDYLKTAGIDLTQDATNLASDATLSSSATQSGVRPTPWANFHTPGLGVGPNYTPGAIKTTERPVALSAVTDGSTANEPYWGNYGTSDTEGYVELDLGSTKTVDNVKVWFMSDRHEGGYQEPSRFYIETPDGSGGWKPIEQQAKSSTHTLAKFNEVLFDPVSTDKLRVAFDNKPGSFTAISEIQAFNSGRDIPEAPNQAPQVSAERSDAGGANLRASLTGEVVDDGAPYDKQLSYSWSVVSTPSGATADLIAPTALSTALQGTAAGVYVVRLAATDGELTSTADVEVTLEPRETEVDFAKTATISTSGASPWEDPEKVNDDGVPASSNPGGPAFGWGTYGQAANGLAPASEATLQYSWDTAVRLTSTELFWYDDGGGISIPAEEAWRLETSDDGTSWTPVTLTNGSNYADALKKDVFNPLTFEPVVARHLRVRIYGAARSASVGGVGVLRWKASGPGVETTRSPVIVRTTVGVAPSLPSTIEAVFTDGTRGNLPVTWPEVASDKYAAVNSDPFAVNGSNADYGQLVPAQVYVRAETADNGITIVSAEQFAQSVDVGEDPVLPTKVTVSYNDGSRDNQAIGVDWAYDPTIVAKEGIYTVSGNLVLPRYVGRSGTTSTRLVLTVGDGEGEEPEPPAADTTGPSISISGVRANVVYPASGNLPLSWRATDASGIASLSAKLDGTSLKPGTLRLFGLRRGSHILVVTAVDVVGNRSVSAVSFKTQATTASLKLMIKQLATADRLTPRQRAQLLSLVRRVEKADKQGRDATVQKSIGHLIRTVRDVRNTQARRELLQEVRGVRRSLRAS